MNDMPLDRPVAECGRVDLAQARAKMRVTIKPINITNSTFLDGNEQRVLITSQRIPQPFHDGFLYVYVSGNPWGFVPCTTVFSTMSQSKWKLKREWCISTMEQLILHVHCPADTFCGYQDDPPADTNSSFVHKNGIVTLEALEDFLHERLKCIKVRYTRLSWTWIVEVVLH